jgi:hypothetical protein
MDKEHQQQKWTRRLNFMVFTRQPTSYTQIGHAWSLVFWGQQLTKYGQFGATTFVSFTRRDRSAAMRNDQSLYRT